MSEPGKTDTSETLGYYPGKMGPKPGDIGEEGQKKIREVLEAREKAAERLKQVERGGLALSSVKLAASPESDAPGGGSAGKGIPKPGEQAAEVPQTHIRTERDKTRQW
jgi:hypothetical protein